LISVAAILQVMPISASGLLQPYFVINIVVRPEELARLTLAIHLSGMELG
jgi:hypothetical protein